VKKSQARIASAWERRNSDQAGPLRRGADRCQHASRSPIPSTPRLVPPVRPVPRGSCGSPRAVLAGQPQDQGTDVPAGRWPTGLASHGPGGPAAADDAAMPAQDRVRGNQQMQPVAAGFWYHAEQGRQESPVRSVQLRAARLLPLQDCELMAQDQDPCGLPSLLTPGEPQPRS
jgi:hypothetical protein